MDALVHAVGVGHGGGVVDAEEAPGDLEEEQTEEEKRLLTDTSIVGVVTDWFWRVSGEGLVLVVKGGRQRDIGLDVFGLLHCVLNNDCCL